MQNQSARLDLTERKLPMPNTATENSVITVEVAYALPERQRIISLQVEAGTSAYEAVLRSGICEEFTAIDPDQDAMGVFSRHLDGKGLPLPKDYVMQAGDRVEIYRPLIIDPKQARLQRADQGNKSK